MIRRALESLKVIVLIGLIVLAAALSFLNFAYHVPRAERAVEDDNRERLNQDFSRLQSSLEYLLLKSDVEGARREVAVLAFNHDYLVAMLTDDAFNVVAATQRAWLGRPAAEVLPGFNSAEAARAVRERRARIGVATDGSSLLAFGGVQMRVGDRELRATRIGNLFLEYDLRRAKAKAIDQIVHQSVYSAVWVIGLALALWIVFHFLLTRRAERLVRAAEQLAAGDLSARSGLKGGDELARLSRALDAMAGRVGETQSRLRLDIAERVRTEEKLRASEQSYRAIFDAAEDAIVVYAIDTGAIVDANHKTCVTYGYSLDELRKLDVASLSAGTQVVTQDSVNKLIARAAAGELLRFEWHRKHKDGTLHWDEIFMKRATIGGCDRILALTREITGRKAAEAALRASEEQYRAMFDASIDGLILRDADGNIVDVNPAMCRMYGNQVEDSEDTIFRGAFRPSYPELGASGEMMQAELTVQCRDGRVLELEVHAVPMQYQGRPHTLTIARDVTDKKRAAEELLRQREKGHQREKLAALGSLLAGVAHELNNPLSVVVARSVMLEEAGDSTTRSAAIKIRTAAERCARIVRTFLAMARQQPPERSPVRIADVVEAALEITGYTLRTNGINVELNLADGAPVILADRDQIHQVVTNLLINAQQALQERPAPRRLALKSWYDSAADMVCLSVSDNGPGIPRELRSRIFEPYFTTKPMGEGTGVGLSVSLGIVESHGGSLTVDCPNDEGAVFSIALPAGNGPVVGAAKRSAEAHGFDPRAMLVVDDEAEVRETLAEILMSAGHHVVTAASGREALQRLDEARYDVILTDMRMPELDGKALYLEIERRWPELARRVVFVTGDTLTTSLREFAARRGRPVIEKPFLPSEVRRVAAEVAA